jgi:DNA-binding MarR family transcriptional regulator
LVGEAFSRFSLLQITNLPLPGTDMTGKIPVQVPVPAFQEVDNLPAAEEHSSGDDPAEIVSAILRAAGKLRGLLSIRLAEFGLNDVRFSALEIVERSSAEGGCSQTELAERMEQSESSISTLVDRMRTSRLLYRLRSKADKRRRVLMLTEQGRDMLMRAREAHASHMEELFRGFDGGQRESFGKLLDDLVASLARLQSQLIAEKAASSGNAAQTSRNPLVIPGTNAQNPAA